MRASVHFENWKRNYRSAFSLRCIILKWFKKRSNRLMRCLGAMPISMPSPFRISEDMVKKMKPGSVIIDLNVSQGGCFETTRCTDLNNPSYIEHGVIHYCVPNLPAIVSRTASIALSNVLIPILISIGEIGGIDNYIKSSKSFRKGVYVYNGILTNSNLSEKFNIPYKDIDLLLAVY